MFSPLSLRRQQAITIPYMSYLNVVDCKIWGLNPAGFHINNLLLHAVNSIIIFQLLSRLIVLYISAKKYGKTEANLEKYGPMFTEKENQLFKKLIQNDQTGKLEAAVEVYHNLQNSIRSRMSHVQKQNRVGGRSGA